MSKYVRVGSVNVYREVDSGGGGDDEFKKIMGLLISVGMLWLFIFIFRGCQG